ncbi:hypothetical protein H2198_001667 [Neophaeococcomyces mojaviensis]|uniref:Uncharacterized protein n=1 Tax=Neophaeococcomyces mojaviensis TaxID=3383035 RepID=A0ACC3AGI3_9EURO|nr:hypothetical protein H2198_001667 [Knufia sp. JES_112]
MAAPQDNTIRVAVLDDYAATAPAYFTPLLEKHPNLAVDYLPDTISTYYNDDGSTNMNLAPQVHRLKQYQIISTMRERTKFPVELLSQLPRLKLLLTTGMRNASIDMEQCDRQGIVVCGTNARGGAAAAAKGTRKGGDMTNEQTWTLILGLMRGLPADDQRVKTNANGGWQDGLATGLAGKTLGILGLGRLGLHCAVTGLFGFGMDVLCWSKNLTQERADELGMERGLEKGTLRVAKDKESFFREADVVSVHYVLSERSRNIVGQEELSWMKKTGFLVNTSRGPLVDESALVAALREGRIKGVGLDVFDIEPLPPGSPWRSQEWGRRVVVSPHMGYVEEGTMNKWYEQTAENVERWLTGQEVINVMRPK